MNTTKRISMILGCLLALSGAAGCEVDVIDDLKSELATGGSDDATGGSDEGTGGDGSSATGGSDDATGGSAATGGSDDGTGGSDEGTGGDDVSATGGMDDSGSGGSDQGSGGDSSGGDTAMYCMEECTEDSDCTIGGANDAGFTCVEGYCMVESSAGGCENDMDCTITFSGWTTACTTTDECPGQVCTEDGFCAMTNEFVSCADVGMSDIETKDIDGADVTVCGNTDYTCSDEGVCENPCESDSECTFGLSKCMDTGACGCADDAECEALGQAVCLDNGMCGCATDADCGDGTDTCYDGVCGCSADSVCGDATFDGTTVSCKSL